MATFEYFCRHQQWQPEQLLRHAVLAEEPGFDMSVAKAHLPLVTDLGADIVTLQMASLDQESLIEMLGSDALPRLKRAAAQHG